MYHLPAILTVIFVIAKLGGYIDWSWWIVFLPTIIPIGLGVFIMLMAVIIAASGVSMDINNKRR